MKKILIPVLFLCAGGQWAAAQTAYLEKVEVQRRDVAKEGRRVVVEMDLDISEMDMKKQHSLQLVPTIVSGDRSQEQALDTLVVNGKIRHKAMRRDDALAGRDEDTTRIRRRNRKEQAVHYEASVPFKRWMIEGGLELRGYVTGCAQCDEGDENANTGPILPFTPPVYALSPKETPAEEVKRRAVTKVARLQFRQDADKIVPSFKNNRQELDSVQASIDAVKNDVNLTITGIYITGYASPEAPFDYNIRLSERRANALKQYVERQNVDIPDTAWHVSGHGEDWEGLRTEVLKHPRLLHQDKVLDIIDNCTGNRDTCEEQLKAIDPSEVYQRLLNEMYGPLRRNEYRIEYNIRSFSLEESRRLLRERPDMLSAAELQRVADSYGQGTPEYREALQIAVDAYPQNTVLRNNAALTCIEAGEYQEAIRLLEGQTHGEGKLCNLLGIAYAHNGQEDDAVRAFREGHQAGYAPATDNLRKIEEMVEYLAEE